MSLSRVTTFWGAQNFFHNPPRSQSYFNTIYRPFSPSTWPDEDPDWGLYGRDGTLIEIGALQRGADRSRVGQSAFNPSPPPLEQAEDAEHIYCGPILPHFGHFLASTLARLWYAAEAVRQRGAKLLFHASHAPETWFAYPYIEAIFHALGITREHCAWYPTPVSIHALTIPQATFEEQFGVHDAFHALAAQIGAALAVEPPADDRPIWLSKTKMRSGVGRFIDEPEMEAVLSEAGVRIVYPEQLPFPEQIALFKGDGVIMGTLGSGFHTHVFSPSQKRLICLCPANLLNSNYKLFDSRQRIATYLYPQEGATKLENHQGFISQYGLKNPKEIAKALLGFAEL